MIDESPSGAPSRHAINLASPWKPRQTFRNGATREDASASRQRDRLAAHSHTAARAYVIRYRSEIADAITSELTVIDGALTLDCTNITEATVRGERRKFLRIECTGEVV